MYEQECVILKCSSGLCQACNRFVLELHGIGDEEGKTKFLLMCENCCPICNRSEK